MKHLKQLSAVAVLVLAFGIPAFAGDMEMPGIAPPPPPTSVQENISSDANRGNIDLLGLEETAINLLISTISSF